MFKKTYFKSGDWNAICDVCGFKFKASKLQKRWDGLMVCNQDFELRHPQDFIRPIKENISVPWTRPRSEGDDVGTVGPTAGELFPSTYNQNPV